MDGAPAETIRQPRNRLKGQPQEHQHSAASRRDAGPTAPGKGCRCERQGWKPARAETASAPFRTARPEGGRHPEIPVLSDLPMRPEKRCGESIDDSSRFPREFLSTSRWRRVDDPKSVAAGISRGTGRSCCHRRSWLSWSAHLGAEAVVGLCDENASALARGGCIQFLFSTILSP
jgi:hypothetical protein